MTQYKPGDEVYGVTNPQFVGAYAELALASSCMVARKPESLSFTEAASVPVVAVTAWQMLFDDARVQPGQTVLILGAGGSVGACAAQFASQAGLHVFAALTPTMRNISEIWANKPSLTISGTASKKSYRW